MNDFVEPLEEVQQIPFKESVASVIKGPTGNFIPIKAASKNFPSKFIGIHHSTKIRFDLMGGDLVAQEHSDLLTTLWKISCSDACLKDNKLYCLKDNNLIELNLKGHIVSKKKLTRSSIQWQTLDPELKYALGFRPRPDYPDNMWPIFILDLNTLRVRQLPILYDLGGHADPKIASGSNHVLLYDLFFTYEILPNSLKHLPWQKTNSDFYAIDHLFFEDSLFVMERHRQTGEIQVGDISSGLIIIKTKIPLIGFVRGCSQSMYVYSQEKDAISIYSSRNRRLLKSCRAMQLQ